MAAMRLLRDGLSRLRTPVPFSRVSLVALACLWVRTPADWLATFAEFDAFSLHCAWDKLDDETLQVARARDIPVLCYTVNERAVAESLFARGVSAVFSDRIDLMRGL